MCIDSIANKGDNVLVPRPGFSLYVTLCQSLGIEVRFYDLLVSSRVALDASYPLLPLQPEKQWEVDLCHLESSIDAQTRAIIINNPSNPCGAVYTEAHLRALIQICERNHIPIIADEIYADMVRRVVHRDKRIHCSLSFQVFTNHSFHFLAALSEKVPVLSCGGISKRFICPGWRVGWIAIHDRQNLFRGRSMPASKDSVTTDTPLVLRYDQAWPVGSIESHSWPELGHTGGSSSDSGRYSSFLLRRHTQ